MFQVDEHPVFWLVEFFLCAVILVLIQLAAGLSTIHISHLSHKRASLFSKYVYLALVFLALGYASARVFDVHTHLLGTMMAALSMAFTTPLQASAYVFQTTYPHIATSKCSTTRSVRSTLLRIAIPGAPPSPRHPKQPCLVHFFRASIYMAVASLFEPFITTTIRRGGVVLDAFALALLTCAANSALSFTSAVLTVCGEPCASPFRHPFFSPSMASFWAGRWNAPVSNALRKGVYEPLCHLGAGRPAAVMACFLVSGISHEIILRFAGVYHSRAEWLAFFLIAGFFTLFEAFVFSKVRLPFMLRWIFTFSILYILFHTLFVPVTIRTGLALRGVETLSAGRVFTSVLCKRFVAAVS